MSIPEHDGERLRKGLFWLTMATVVLYLTFIGVGIYLYYDSDHSDQLEKNTERLNKTIIDFCEIVFALDADEPEAIHDLSMGRLIVSSTDCKIIARHLKEENKK